VAGGGSAESSERVAMNDLKVSLMLADFAQVAAGKLYINGGGWSIMGPQPTPFAIVLDVKVPWHAINIEHALRIELLDADGQPVEIETPDGPQPLRLDGRFQATPAPNVKPGTQIDLPLAFNLPPQPIPAGGRYEWRLSIDGETDEDWRLVFSTRPEPAGEAS
jgi:hypothetical protein